MKTDTPTTIPNGEVVMETNTTMTLPNDTKKQGLVLKEKRTNHVTGDETTENDDQAATEKDAPVATEKETTEIETETEIIETETEKDAPVATENTETETTETEIETEKGTETEKEREGHDRLTDENEDLGRLLGNVVGTDQHLGLPLLNYQKNHALISKCFETCMDLEKKNLIRINLLGT